MGLAGYQDDKGSMQFETGFDIGDAVTYAGETATVQQIVTGATAADPIRLLLTVEGEEKLVNAKAVTKS